MISDEERREVAARLRNNLVYMRDNREFYENDLDVVKCGNKAYRNIANSVERFANFEDGNYIHICETLADLIDRPVTHNIAEHPGFKCKLCGDEWPLDIGFDYCPRCGAEVMEGD